MDEQAPCIGTIKGGRQILFCGISRPPWLFPEIPGNFPRILKGTGIPAHPCYFAFGGGGGYPPIPQNSFRKGGEKQDVENTPKYTKTNCI